MVILVDHEDDREGERELNSSETRSASQRGSKHTTEALPWNEIRQRADSSDTSSSILGDTADPQSFDEIGRPKIRRPIFRQPSEMDDPAQAPFGMGPGSRIGGRAFSVTSNCESRISIDAGKGSSIGGADDRPPSKGSTFVSIQDAMQPKVKIAGRPSFDGDGTRKAPINMPGRDDATRETNMAGRPSARRTYKSLSPYGILFED